MPSDQCVLLFHATRAGFDEAAGRLRDLLDARRLSGRPRYNLELVFEEVSTNIIRHGSPSGDVEVVIAFHEQEIVLTFEDNGAPFDPRDHPAPTMAVSIDGAVAGGLGLVLVRQISTRLTYERTPQHRNRLTLAISAR